MKGKTGGEPPQAAGVIRDDICAKRAVRLDRLSMSGCECKRDSAQPVIKGIRPMRIWPDSPFFRQNRSRWKFKSSADYSNKSLNTFEKVAEVSNLQLNFQNIC